ncbi:MAG: hypothetical protein KatS3mg105_3843 [Gemmatales bacterium]|nr:MAG: hypothetical protein KatS3mg105_3843 [Gemmatales bacterium]
MIRFLCPTCEKVLKAPPERGGVIIHCPRCGQGLEIPRTSSVSADKKQRKAEKAARHKAASGVGALPIAGPPPGVAAPPPVSKPAPAVKPAMGAPATAPIVTPPARVRRVKPRTFLFLLFFLLIFATAGGLVWAAYKGYTFGIDLSFLKPARNNDRLTEEERHQWHTLRQGLDRNKTYIIVGFLRDENDWRVCKQNRVYDTHSWGFDLDRWSKEELEDVKYFAKELLGKDKKSVATIGIIDLFTDESPQPVVFYILEETGVLAKKNPPTSEQAKLLDDFIYNLQTGKFD